MDCFKNCCKDEANNDENQIEYQNQNQLNRNQLNRNNLNNIELKNAILDPTVECQKLFSSLTDIIAKLTNIKDKKPASPKEMETFIEKIAIEHDQQIGEINKMKQRIKELNDKARTNGTIKLKNIEKNDAFNTVVETVTGNLSTVLATLQEANNRENQLSSALKEAAEGMERLQEVIKKSGDQTFILAQSRAVDYQAPDNANNINKDSGTRDDLRDMFNDTVPVHFLSKDGKKLLTGNDLTNSYDKKNFSNSCFYYFNGTEYKKLDNLKGIDDLDTNNIILAHRKIK